MLGYSQPHLPSPLRFLCILLLSAALFSFDALAQQVLVQNGATAEVSNGGVWDLQGGTMDFGSNPTDEVNYLSFYDEDGNSVGAGPLWRRRA